MTEVLSFINSELEAVGVNYFFGENKQSPPGYPYWVGSYTAADGANEDGETDLTFILSGFFRGLTLYEIELEKEKIINHFKFGSTAKLKCGAVAVYYQNSLDLPQDLDELHISEIYLAVKYWKGK